MLTFILIGGLIWLAVALVFVFALALAARKSVSPVAPAVDQPAPINAAIAEGSPKALVPPVAENEPEVVAR